MRVESCGQAVIEDLLVVHSTPTTLRNAAQP